MNITAGPYRMPSPKVQDPAGVMSGFIHPPHAPHKCSPPGFLDRFFSRTKVGSLWRCGSCGQVWKWADTFEFTDEYQEWKEAPLKEWIVAGGVEK